MLDELRRRPLEEPGHPFELLRQIDDRRFEVAEEDVAEDADRKVGLLEDESRRLGLLDPAIEHLVQLVQIADLPHEVGFLRSMRGGPNDQAAGALVGAVDHAAQPVAL